MCSQGKLKSACASAKLDHCSYEETSSLAVQNAPREDSDQTAKSAQSDLNLHRAQMSKGTFSAVQAHLHQLTEKNQILRPKRHEPLFSEKVLIRFNCAVAK